MAVFVRIQHKTTENIDCGVSHLLADHCGDFDRVGDEPAQVPLFNEHNIVEIEDDGVRPTKDIGTKADMPFG